MVHPIAGTRKRSENPEVDQEIAEGLLQDPKERAEHVMLVDLRAKKMTGKEAEKVLGDAHITCNKNGIPNDPEKPMVTSGIRLGSPAMTTRGFKEAEARQVGSFIADILDNPNDPANIAKVRAQVAELTKRFPVYG